MLGLLALPASVGLSYLFCYGGFEGPVDWAMHTITHGSRERRLPPALTAETEANVRDRAIIGTPEQVAEQIAEYRDALGPTGQFIARAYFPGLDPGIQRETMRIFGEEVRALLV